MSQARRLAAILAADVVGYSRLMGADEEGTLAALKAIRREIGEPQGQGAQGPHRQNDRRRAVDRVRQHRRCGALRGRGATSDGRAQRSPPRGAALRVPRGRQPGRYHRDGRDIYGDGVNIAARLETLAEPGAVFVSNTVYEHVRDRLPFAFDDLGEQQVKNIARPVHVYRVRPEAASPTPAQT